MHIFNSRHNRTSFILSGEAPTLSVKNRLNWTLTNQGAPCFFNRFPGQSQALVLARALPPSGGNMTLFGS